MRQNRQENNSSHAQLKIYLKISILLCCSLLIGCSEDDSLEKPEISELNSRDFLRGMDLSFLPETESFNVQFKDSNNQPIANNYKFLAGAGVNLIRIRLWVNHPDNRYDLENLKRQAAKAAAVGMELLLDIHYSDIWADPGAQRTPVAWSNLNSENLAVAAANYTENVIRELQLNNTPPAIVQIGNETNSGMLWPIGRVYDNGVENWENYAQISRTIAAKIRQVSPTSQIMIHHAGTDNADYFFQQLVDRNVPFDIIGLSYYPKFHGTDILQWTADVNTLSRKRTQKIMVVETAYPFTLGSNDNLNNVVWNDSHLVAGFPATPVGQRDFLIKLESVLKSLPNDQGMGYCYWAPDWVSFPTSFQSFTQGSNWENMALFDFNFKTTTGLDAYSN